jgi:hypothetical protein
LNRPLKLKHYRLAIEAIMDGDCNAITKTMSLDGKTATTTNRSGKVRLRDSKIGGDGGAATCGERTDRESCVVRLVFPMLAQS